MSSRRRSHVVAHEPLIGTGVIDAHVHFWNLAALEYPWLRSTPALSRPFLPEDLESLGTGVLDGVVFVEGNCLPSQNIAEIDFVNALAQREPRIIGTVAYVDLCDAPGRRLSFDRLAQRERVVGIRHNIQGQLEGFSLHPEFVRGAQEASAHGFTFDLCITAEQLTEVTELVRRCPDTRFVLDHCGKPAIRDAMFEPWASDIARLAEHANVSCKLSGLLTEASPAQRDRAGLLEYVQHVISCFGATRVMYGSDWPVVTTSGGEPAWRALADGFTSGWTPSDRQAFFGDNAIRFYGLRSNAHP